MLWVPTGMYYSKFRQVQVHRQSFEPLNHTVVQFAPLTYLLKKGSVLLQVFFNMGAKMFTRVLLVFRSPGYCVEFVVAHNRQSVTLFNHVLGNDDGFYLFRAAVYEVTQENNLSLGVLPHAACFAVIHLGEEGFEFSGVAVNIADQVVHLSSLFGKSFSHSSALTGRNVRLRLVRSISNTD